MSELEVKAPEVPRRQHVFIAIPTMGSKCGNDICGLTEAAVSLNSQENFPYRFSVRRVNDVDGVEHARNKLIGTFLQTDAERIWFMDYDTKPSPNSFELLFVGGDIVAGIYPIYQFDQPMRVHFGVYKDMGTLDRFGQAEFKCLEIPTHGNPILDVDGVVMGNTLIHRRLFEDQRLLLGPQVEAGEPPFFRSVRDVAGHLRATEDLDFCKRAKDLGYTIRCHTGIKWGHFKNFDLNRAVEMLEIGFQIGLQTSPEELQDAPKIVVARA